MHSMDNGCGYAWVYMSLDEYRLITIENLWVVVLIRKFKSHNT
jgi:hypothetical protein